MLREYPAVGVAPLTPDEADKIKKWEQCERKYRQDGPAWASERAGQYFCYVEQSAGIWEKDGKKYAGPINIPDKNQKFFIRIEKEIRTNMTKALCSKDLEYFSHYLSTYDAFESSDLSMDGHQKCGSQPRVMPAASVSERA